MLFEKEISYYNPNINNKNWKSIFLIEKPSFLTDFLKIISAAFMPNKTLKARNSTTTHKNF